VRFPSIVDQLPALAGAFVIAFATVVATGILDRTRWKREHGIRWDERRHEAFARYGQAIKQLHFLATSMSASRRPDSKTQPLEHQIGLQRLVQAKVDRAGAWESVLLLGDPATVEAARQWRAAVWQMEPFARQVVTEPDRWEEAVLLAVPARERFYEPARSSLVVPGDLPPSSRALGEKRAASRINIFAFLAT
jgi:hypothetical protein